MELTIEQMCNIVDNAPEGAKAYNVKMKTYTNGFIKCYSDVFLNELKSKIDNYYYGQSEEDELRQHKVLSQEKIEGGVKLIGNFNQSFISKCADYQDVIANQQTKIDELEKRLKGVEEIMNDYYTGSFDDAPELAGWISTALNGDMEV